MATTEETVKYLKTQGYQAPDALEIEGARGDVPSPTPVSSEPTFNIDPAKFTSVYKSLTSSSADAVTDENKTKETIQKTIADTTAQDELLKQHYAQIDARRAELNQRRADEIAGINAGFAQTKKETEGAQVREKGSTAVSLARIGGYLGGTASGTGAMLNLAERHRNEIASLEVKRQAAVRAARQAADDKDFELAKLRVTEARQILGDIEKKKQDFFLNNQRLVEKMEAAENTIRDDARSSLTAIIDKYGGIDLESFNESTQLQIASLAQKAGIPLESIIGPSFAATKEQSDERQREISNAIALANLRLSTARFEEADKISDTEITRLGLPRALIGTSKTELESQFDSEIPPQWFVNFQKNQGKLAGGDTAPRAIELWTKFRNEVVKANPLIDFGTSLGLPPPITE